MITNTELEQILELEKKATPGPWERDGAIFRDKIGTWIGDTSSPNRLIPREQSVSNAELVCLMREKILQICEELLCAREVIKYLDDYNDSPSWEGQKELKDAVKAYTALCAPQEKTGEAKL